MSNFVKVYILIDTRWNIVLTVWDSREKAEGARGQIVRDIFVPKQYIEIIERKVNDPRTPKGDEDEQAS